MQLFQFYEYFLPAILLLGLFTSYEDIQHRKIRNIYVLLGIIVGTAANAYLFLSGMVDSSYIWFTLSNIIIACLAAFVLYASDFWYAGDGKLLIAYSFVTPITIATEKSQLGSIWLVALLLNTFIPYLLVASVASMSDSLISHKKKEGISRSIFILLGEMMYIFAITWLSRLLLMPTSLGGNYLVIALASGIMIWLNERANRLFEFIIVSLFPGKRNIKRLDYAKRAYNIIGYIAKMGLCFFAIAADYRKIASASPVFFVEFIALYLILSLVRRNIQESATALFTRNAKVSALKKGMIIHGTIVEIEGYYKLANERKDKNFRASRFQGVLSDESIKELIMLKRTGKLLFEEVAVDSTLPFAPLMFIGSVITIITGASLFLLQSIN